VFISEQFVLDGWTALMYAAVKNHVEVVKVLLAAGADPSIRTNATKLGRTALIKAEACVLRRPRVADTFHLLSIADLVATCSQ
jgi:ankyrin repeat protein